MNHELRVTNYELRHSLFAIRYSLFAIGCLLFALCLSGCGGKATPTATGNVVLTEVFPTVDGWTADGDVQTYNSETIFELVDGQADAFFAYNFEQVAVQSYKNDADAVLRIEIWQLATPADAYGLFTRNRAGELADVGNEGDTDPGRRLAFWQNRYYAQVRGRQALADADLHTFADALVTALPTGGETPALMAKFPAEGLASAIFFRKEISIQDIVWLGGENVLNLGTETQAALATYELPDAQVYLLLVQYPTADAASAALTALQNASVDDLVASDTRDTLLGAVFGETDVASPALLLLALP